MVLHQLKRCFEALQTISKHKQNKDIQKVDLGMCHLAFALQKWVMVIAAVIYTFSSQKLQKSELSYPYYPHTKHLSFLSTRNLPIDCLKR